MNLSTDWLSVSVYAIIVMIMMCIFARRYTESGRGRKLYVCLAVITIVDLAFDAISRCWIYPAWPTAIVQVATYLNFLVLPFVAAAWYIYSKVLMSAGANIGERAFDMVIFALCAVSSLAVLTTPFTNGVFSFDASGHYVRGFIYALPATVTCVISGLTEVYLVINIGNVVRHARASMLTFPLPPFIGSILQANFYGLPWMLIGFSLSLVMLFVTIQNIGLNTDYLTGAYNRKRMDELMSSMIVRAKSGHGFSAIMLDIDGFKSINDKLGHTVGDAALVETARILRRCVRLSDIIARYGGDEFVILIDSEDSKGLEAIIERIENQCALHNRDTVGYKISLSKGCAVYDAKTYPTVEAFMSHIDALMYDDKIKRTGADKIGESSQRRASREGAVA